MYHHIQTELLIVSRFFTAAMRLYALPSAEKIRLTFLQTWKSGVVCNDDFITSRFFGLV